MRWVYRVTICIAAIGKYGKGTNEAILFATDHMVGVPVGQFEHAIEKYKCVGKNCVVMFSSSNALLFEEIVKGIDGEKGFDEVCGTIHQRMIDLRLEKIQKQILASFDVDWAYIKSILDKPINNVFIGQIIESIAKYKLDSQMLSIGFNEKGAQMNIISEDENVALRDFNFAAIGSGTAQAFNTMLFQKHSKENSLETTLYNVYKAKRNSEVAQGVGKETDLLILFRDKIEKLTQGELDTLQRIYEKEHEFGIRHAGLKTITDRFL